MCRSSWFMDTTSNCWSIWVYKVIYFLSMRTFYHKSQNRKLLVKMSLKESSGNSPISLYENVTYDFKISKHQDGEGFFFSFAKTDPITKTRVNLWNVTLSQVRQTRSYTTEGFHRPNIIELLFKGNKHINFIQLCSN